ncbi:MAG: sigma-54-dependent Fis family transcriptional regulator [Tissierellia bacterium]|nr:sigma-54-dependent Fis family transcriptional regulator [Tissierellia bacterium]
MKKKILIIDDEEMIRLSLAEGLKDMGYSVDAASDGKEALEKARVFAPDMALLDMKLGDENGLDILPKLKDLDSDIEVVIMTAYGDIESAVKAIKLGAYDYINKPFNLLEIDVIIKRVVSKQEQKNRLFTLEKSKGQQSYESNLIGEDPLMLEVLEKINILSKNDDVTVLIRGETGTGKDLVASAIHNHSIRKNRNMLKVNCASTPEQLMESEFFGFEKNAFTGANTGKKGLMEVADGGTVFLDEIGEMPMNLQSKLLTFIEDKNFRRVGGLANIEVDVRIIAATNKELEKAIKNKEFREDLYYRLNVIPLHLPPLRERGQDIILLANHFLEKYSKKYNKNINLFTDEAIDKLLNYQWPGNVRELKNVLERAVLLGSKEKITAKDLPLIHEVARDKNNKVEKDISLYPNFSLEKEVENMERKYIKLALEESENNYTKAAEILGLSRYALKRRLEKYF